MSFQYLSKSELEVLLNKVIADYKKELSTNGLTGKLEDLSRKEALIKTKLKR